MEHLKQLRLAKGLLQRDVATLLGVDRTTYVKYENGSSEPSYEILKKLADYFNVTVDYLLDRVTFEMNNPSTTSPSLNARDERDIAKRLQALDEDLANQETLMLSGEIMDEETRELLKSALASVVRISKIKAKEKFNPNKNKKK